MTAVTMLPLKKIENPRLGNKKNQENPRSNFYALFGKFQEKIALFLKKNNIFPKKISFYPPKFLMTFFFFFFSKFLPFFPKTNKINLFSGKFLKNPKKTQGPFNLKKP